MAAVFSRGKRALVRKVGPTQLVLKAVTMSSGLSTSRVLLEGRTPALLINRFRPLSAPTRSRTFGTKSGSKEAKSARKTNFFKNFASFFERPRKLEVPEISRNLSFPREYR